MPQAGDAFWWDQGGRGRHLWVVLSGPNTDLSVLIVNLTDYKNVPKPVLQINKGTKILTSGFCATVTSTLYTSGALVVPAEAVDVLLENFGRHVLNPSLLKPFREAMYKATCDRPVMDFLTACLTKWP